MNNHENLTSSTWGLVSSLAELHAWELDNLPLLSTLTGRHLYFRMAEETFQPEVALTKALKDLFGGAHFTEKALRSRLREMESGPNWCSHRTAACSRNCMSKKAIASKPVSCWPLCKRSGQRQRYPTAVPK